MAKDDDEVAEALNEESLTAISDAEERFLDSVKNGDGDRLRAAFQGPDSYLLGLNNAHGRLETILSRRRCARRWTCSCSGSFSKSSASGASW